jgi:hypothetical protein
VTIEGYDGEGAPNPCHHCGKHSTQPGTPNFANRLVTYSCPYCKRRWSRPFEDELGDDDVVRVDLDEGYIYGGVMQVDGDRVLVYPHDPPGPQVWYERWRVIVY